MSIKVAYVTNTDANNISVIDLSKNEEIGVIPIGGSPRGAMAIDEDGKFGYVSNCAGNTVSKIDLKKSVETTKIEVGLAPRGIAIADNLLFVANSGSNDISIIDTLIETEVSRISTGNNPRALSITPNFKYLNVPCWGSDELSIFHIDMVKPEKSYELERIHLGVDSKPYHAYSSEDNRHVYTANTHEHTIKVVDILSKEVISTIPVGYGPRAVIEDIKRNLLYVSCEASDSLSIINKSSWKNINDVSVGSTPRGLKIDYETDNLYISLFSRGVVVTNQIRNALTVVDLKKQKVSGSIKTGLGPCSISIFNVEENVIDEFLLRENEKFVLV